MTEIRASVELGLGPDLYNVPETSATSDDPIGLVGSVRVRTGVAVGEPHILTYGLSLGVQRVAGELDVPNSKISDVYLGTTIPEDPQNCPDTTCYKSQNFNRTGIDLTAFFSNRFGQFGYQVDMGTRFHTFDNGHAYLDNNLLTEDTVGIQHALHSSISMLLRPSLSYHFGPVAAMAGVDVSAGTIQVTSPSGANGKTNSMNYQPFAGLSVQFGETPLKTKHNPESAENDTTPDSTVNETIPSETTPTTHPFTLSVLNLDVTQDKLARVEIPFTGDTHSLKIELATRFNEPRIPVTFEVSEYSLILDLSKNIQTSGEVKLICTTENGVSILTLNVQPVAAERTEKPKPVAPKVDVSGWE